VQPESAHRPTLIMFHGMDGIEITWSDVGHDDLHHVSHEFAYTADTISHSSHYCKSMREQQPYI